MLRSFEEPKTREHALHPYQRRKLDLHRPLDANILGYILRRDRTEYQTEEQDYL
jgi:hypothetical protein